jgi:hypothetical protein
MGNEDELNKKELPDSEFPEIRNMLLRLRKIKASEDFYSRLKLRLLSEVSDETFVNRLTVSKIPAPSKGGAFWKPVFATFTIIGIAFLVVFSIYNLSQPPTKITTPSSFKQPYIPPQTTENPLPEYEHLREQLQDLNKTLDKLSITENTRPKKSTDNKLKVDTKKDESSTQVKDLETKTSTQVEEKSPSPTPKVITTKPESSEITKEPTEVSTKKESTTKPDKPGVLAMPKTDSNAIRGQKTKKILKQTIKDEDVTKEQLEKIKEEILDNIKKDF